MLAVDAFFAGMVREEWSVHTRRLRVRSCERTRERVGVGVDVTEELIVVVMMGGIVELQWVKKFGETGNE